MRLQKQMPGRANHLLLAIGLLLALGLLFGLVHFALNQSYIVFADEDGVIDEDDIIDEEDRPEGSGGVDKGGVDGESNGTGEDTGVDPAEPETQPGDAPSDGEDVEQVAGVTIPIYLPFVGNAPPIPTISATKPNSNNDWVVSWSVTDDSNLTGYVLQESQTIDFSMSVVSYTLGVTNSQFIDKNASPNNTYFYRVRSLADDLESEWSNTIAVHGAYLDNFNDDSTGWQARRMTFLEQTNVYYGSGVEAGYLIAITADRWDWVLGSPFRYAPAVPYQIEYRMRVHDPSNLVSGGVVLGGDWNGDACPEIGNVYRTDNCFNQFYNFNMIYFGPMKLLFEQVNRLDYCPTCGGSQLKRLGPTEVVENIDGLGNPANDWHNYRITVQDDGLRFYVDDKFVRHFTDTTYIHRPYFGVFTSTDEYKPSIYFYDYFAVTPLD